MLGYFFEIIDILEKTGWLPYNNEIVKLAYEFRDEPELLDKEIIQYFNLNWVNIKQELILRLDGYDIDEEAKETFKEAMTAYENNLYRSVCRVLFPD